LLAEKEDLETIEQYADLVDDRAVEISGKTHAWDLSTDFAGSSSPHLSAD
jgi:hypothetical protein